MVKRSRKQGRIVDRDYDILEHISRFHLTTRDVLHSLFFQDTELNAVTKVTSRLVDYEFITSHDLHAGKKYFVVGHAGARFLGLAYRKCKPLGPQSLVQKYAVLQFCCAGPVYREKLLVQDLQKALGSLKGKHMHAGMYYRDTEGAQPRLAQMRVDFGTPAAHVIRKCRTDLEALLRVPQIAQLVESQRFMLTILTLSEARKTDIQNAILRHSWPVRFRVEVVPDLAEVVASKYRSRLDQAGG